MNYRKLSDSDPRVSEISLGSWLTYSVGWSRSTPRRAPSAPSMGDQLLRHGERLQARSRRGGLGRDPQPLQARGVHPRDQGLLPDEKGRSAGSVMQIELDASLKRLQTEYVDLYQCHRRHRDSDRGDDGGADGGGHLGEGALHRLQRVDAGADRGGDRARARRIAEMQSSQPQYNIIWRAPEAEVFELCWEPRSARSSGRRSDRGADREIQARGGASRRIARDQQRDGLGDGPLHVGRSADRGAAAAADRRRGRADDADGARLGTAAQGAASAIIGASRPGQVTANASASGIELSKDVLEAIDRAVEDVVVTGRRLPASPRRASSTGDTVDDRLGRLRDPRRCPAEPPRLASVVREGGGLAGRQGEILGPMIEQPPAALAAVGQLHGLQPGLFPAGEAEVGLGADVSASVVATVAGPISLVRQALIEGRLDLALQLVGRCQPALRELGATSA